MLDVKNVRLPNAQKRVFGVSNGKKLHEREQLYRRFPLLYPYPQGRSRLTHSEEGEAWVCFFLSDCLSHLARSVFSGRSSSAATVSSAGIQL